MPPSIPTIFFIISSILTLTLTLTTVASASRPPPLVRRACSNASVNIDTELCMKVLGSVPSVASARDLVGLSVSIIEAGISNSTNTRSHVEHVLNRTGGGKQGAKEAFEECKVAYDQIVVRFGSALREVKVKEYLAPTYDLLTASTDCVSSCRRAMERADVADEIVSRGNRIVPVFGISAFSVVGELDQLTPPPRRA